MLKKDRKIKILEDKAAEFDKAGGITKIYCLKRENDELQK